MIVFAPLNEIELRNMLYTAQLEKIQQPLSIRYPRGRGANLHWKNPFEEIEIGKSICLNPGTEIAVLTIGTIGNTAKEVIQGFSIVDQKKIAHHNMRFVKPLDTSLLHRIFKDYNTIITIEEGILAGGFGSAILEFAQENNYQNHTIKRLGIPDTFIEHGKVPELHKKTELDTAHIKSVITNFL